MSIKSRLERLEADAAMRARLMMQAAPDSAFDQWLAEAMTLPLVERIRRIVELTPAQAERLRHCWEFWARPEQMLPAGAWTFWLLLAGRGFGKTRVGAETVRVWARTHRYVNLLGATSDDARDIMVDGEAGVLAMCPTHERPEYRKSERKLIWPSGCQSLIFTADEPERLRGKQHERLWCDELAAWRYPEAWTQALLGLRLSKNPQAVITTTPRPGPLIRGLLADPACVVTRGTSYDNRANLAESFYSSIIRKYEGSRLGRQELNAELLSDNPGALWQRDNIDKHRVRVAPTLRRVVVGVDPAVTSGEDADHTGIVVAGLGDDAHFYVLDDRSLRASPDGWARTAVAAYHAHRADRVIGETNNGGDLIEAVLRTVDANVAYTKVTATRGKAIRAEPIAALYEQGRVHHVGSFAQLEDQMCDFDPLVSRSSPDRMDALVWAMVELVQGGSTGLLEFMRAEAERVTGLAVHEATVRLRLPANLGAVQVGSAMVYGDERREVEVPADMVSRLLAAGLTRADEFTN